MPKDEFDFEDPMELSGVVLPSDADTTDAMCECFIEEYMRLGYNHKQVYALFRNRHYIGMNMVLQKRGEHFVRERISEVFACWGRAVEWQSAEPPAPVASIALEIALETQDLLEPERSAKLTDPMGNPAPKLDFQI